MFRWLFFILFVIAGIGASITDWQKKQIPNRYPLSMLGVGILQIACGLLSIQSTLIGMVLSAVPILFLLLIWRDKLGWGDVRYMIACGIAVGGIYAAYGALLSYAAHFLYAVVRRCQKKLTPNAGVPFAPFMTAGFGGAFILNLISGVIIHG